MAASQPMGKVMSCCTVKVQATQAKYRPLDEPGDPMDGPKVELEVRTKELRGTGHFSRVFRASVAEERGEPFLVALKKTVYNPNVKDREIECLRALNHVNIVTMYYFYWAKNEDNCKEMCLVLEYMPTTVHAEQSLAAKKHMCVPVVEIKLWLLQLFKGVAYMHSLDICHRDIKPQNLLLDRATGILKLGDFGSAKVLDPNNNLPYIVSRWYRAPELILKNKRYTDKIDVWAIGCVVGELLRNRVLFPADKDDKQLLLFMKYIGTPTVDQINGMHPKEPFVPSVQLANRPWKEVLPSFVPLTGSELLTGLLQWNPSDRLDAETATTFGFFDDVRNNRQLILPGGNRIHPDIFGPQTTTSPNL